MLSTFVLKVASRCNINCDYCYVYNKADQSWRRRPTTMSPAIFRKCLDRIEIYCRAANLRALSITFHGGEPTLLGPNLLADFAGQIRSRLAFLGRVRLGIQTNAVDVEEAVIRVLARHDFIVGVSIDGDRESHDKARRDHQGHNTYDRVCTGISRMLESGLNVGALCLAPIGHPHPPSVHEAIRATGVSSVDYLLPDVDRLEHCEIVRRHGPTPLFRALYPIFDHWLTTDPVGFKVRLFHSMLRLILGGSGDIDIFGGDLSNYLFIEADGSYEPLDVLRVCGDGLTRTRLNVFDHDIAECTMDTGILGASLRAEFALPSGCAACPEAGTCGGGYLPHRHRFDAAADVLKRFDHPSLWCEDLKALFSHVRQVLDVAEGETSRRKATLAGLAGEVS
jgi:uncharacterized protein